MSRVGSAYKNSQNYDKTSNIEQSTKYTEGIRSTLYRACTYELDSIQIERKLLEKRKKRRRTRYIRFTQVQPNTDLTILTKIAKSSKIRRFIT